MHWKGVHGIGSLILFISLLGSLFCYSEGWAANRVRGASILKEDECMKLFLFTDESPRFRISLLNRSVLVLSFLDTSISPQVCKDLSESRPKEVTITGQAGALKLDCLHPIREVSTAWMSEKKLFYVEILPLKAEPRGRRAEAAFPTLRRIRFGASKSYTRMVLDLTGRPAWELSLEKPGRLGLRLEKVGTQKKRSEFGPMKRLDKVILDGKSQQVDLSMALKSPFARARIFWLHVGNRLVMDLCDEPSVPIPVPQPVSRSGERRSSIGEHNVGNESVREVEPVANSASGKSVLQEKTRDRGTVKEEEKIDKDQASVNHEGAEDEKAIVRASSTDESPVAALRNEGTGDDPLHGVSAAEALLYGQITEAHRFRDYERGAALIDDFIKRFPESSLTEKLTFMKGDFQYFLMLSGREDLLPLLVETYKGAINRFPRSDEVPGAYLRMAKANRMAGNDYQALGYLNILIRRYGNDPLLPEAYLERGSLDLRGPSPEKALRDFKAVLKSYPRSMLAQEARYGIATYLHEQKLYQEAEKWLNEIAISGPDFCGRHPEYLSLRARNFLYLEKPGEAREMFFKALNVGGQLETNDLTLTRIGDTFLHQSRSKEAETLYKRVVEDFPDTEGASISQIRLAELSSEVDALEEVAKRNTERPIGEIALLQMANVFYDKGKFSKTMDTVRELVMTPPISETQAAAGHLYQKAAEKELKRLYQEKKFGEVVELFKANESSLSGKIDPQAQLAFCRSLFRLGKYDEAVSAFHKLEPDDLEPENKGAYYLDLAQSYRSLGNLERGIDLLRRARASDLLPLYRQKVTLFLADLSREAHKFQEALGLYEEVLAGKTPLSAKEIAQAYYFTGKILNLEGDFEKAREKLNKSIELTEKDETGKDISLSAICELGEGFLREGRPEEAIKCFQSAIRSGFGQERDGYWDMKFRLAEAYMQVKKADRAEELLKEISQEGDPGLQSQAQLKMGYIKLEKELKRLSIWSKVDGMNTADEKR
jgi:FimV-like protein